MGNYIQKVITIFAIIPYLSKLFNLNKENIIKKEKNIIRQEHDFVEWGQFIELDNYNRDKMS
tara:strand:- start:499 stop:684 length:186 start_codon:yes stop_codon:yes gene_type:complete